MALKQHTTAQAYDLLREGHARTLSGERQYGSGVGLERALQLTGGQAPYASVLCCADSRVPPEHIFDAGLGDLFVCRNAGNILDDLALGSFEYAAAHTGCPLLVVLGHTSCGAVGAAVAAVKKPEDTESPHVDSVIQRLMPAVIATVPRNGGDMSDWVDDAARWNVERICEDALRRSAILRDLHRQGKFNVLGAMYDLETAQVSFMQTE